MEKSMCITYEVEGALYVNMTNRCSNRCDFCIRNNADGAYGSEPLWLLREPSVDEVVQSVLSRDTSAYRELVYCGYGEPTFRLYDIIEVQRRIRHKGVSLPVRINTNGQSDLILGCDSAPLFAGVFDTVSISLNAPSAEAYQQICHSTFGTKCFESILNFAENVNKYVKNTAFSVVREFLSADDILKCQKIADAAGIQLRIRDYIPPADT